MLDGPNERPGFGPDWARRCNCQNIAWSVTVILWEQETVEEWAPEELFWVIKNGVKMTGMPAWGPTHSDAKLWAIVAFLEKLPQMSAQQYQEMDKTAGPGEVDHDPAAAGAAHDHEAGAATAPHHDADRGDQPDHPH